MKRVLIVDDAIELGRMLQDTLKTVHPGIAVSVVPSAEEGLLEATRLTIDLLVTDLRLPGMTGLELIRKIRVRQPNVKVILMTGLAQDERMVQQRTEVNPDIFFRKPITASDFLEAVDQLLSIGQTPPPDPARAGETTQDIVLRELEALLPGEAVVPAGGPKGKTAPLRKGTGSLPAEPIQTPADEGLSGILSRLRSSLGAFSAMLLDESGHPVAQAGDLPDPAVSAQLLPPVMAALSAGAKISYLLGQASTRSVQGYRGDLFDLMIAPVGQYSLLMALRPGRSSMRLALAFEESINAQNELAEALEAMGLHVHSTAEAGAPETLRAEVDESEEGQADEMPAEILETPLGQDPSLEKFEELFSRKQTGQLNLQDPDTFWEQVETGERGDLTQPGMLSFDQAQKLGLLPEE
jgi:CheY-like chemotaxis protein